MRTLTIAEQSKVAGGRQFDPITTDFKVGFAPDLMKEPPPTDPTNLPDIPVNADYWTATDEMFQELSIYTYEYVGLPGSGLRGGGGTSPDTESELVNQAACVLSCMGYYLPQGWSISVGSYFEFKDHTNGQIYYPSSYQPRSPDDSEIDGSASASNDLVVIDKDSMSPSSSQQSPFGASWTILEDDNGQPSTNGGHVVHVTGPQLNALESAIATLAHEYYHAAVDAEQGAPNAAWTTIEEERAETQAYIAVNEYMQNPGKYANC